MSSRIPKSEEWWETETRFIENESKKDYYRMGGFQTYCDMQARFAKLDGFTPKADRILNAKERAK